MISVQNLIKSYSGNIAVDIPELQVNKGDAVGLVGNNGAGKTSFFRLLLDLIKADGGEIYSKQKKVALNEEWKSYTAAYLDESFLIGYLTPEEYFYFVGQLHQFSQSDIQEKLKKFERFFDGAILNSGKYIRDLSKGNQFKLGIAACLIQEPEVLILDEPFANLDPTTQIRLIELLRDCHEQQQMTLLISSHDLNHVTTVCSRILLMEKGKIIRDEARTDQTLQALEKYFNV